MPIGATIHPTSRAACSLHHPMGRACYPPVRTGTARDSKRVRIAIPRDSAGLLEGREACKLCHWNHPHAYQGHYSPCGRARHLLLDTARASNPFAAFIEMTVRVSSFKAGSVGAMVLASLSPVLTVVVRQLAYFHRTFPDAPRCRAVRRSSGTCRL
jgi:hypothetical protein